MRRTSYVSTRVLLRELHGILETKGDHDTTIKLLQIYKNSIYIFIM